MPDSFGPVMPIARLAEAETPVRCDVPGWKDRMVESLGVRGIAVYRDLEDPMQLLDFAAAVGDVVDHRHSNAHGFADLSEGEEGV